MKPVALLQKHEHRRCPRIPGIRQLVDMRFVREHNGRLRSGKKSRKQNTGAGRMKSSPLSDMKEMKVSMRFIEVTRVHGQGQDV